MDDTPLHGQVFPLLLLPVNDEGIVVSIQGFQGVVLRRVLRIILDREVVSLSAVIVTFFNPRVY